jgi:hypothetical protein
MAERYGYIFKVQRLNDSVGFESSPIFDNSKTAAAKRLSMTYSPPDWKLTFLRKIDTKKGT